ncbi:hypothetical protein CISIN_1g041307mg [Citrus sinensis]|uniref:Uncharacterized protein n=1 Tax=Citrus sinensis TaxID=2711 RepID=A0A067D4G8_CITSI|nr:hypothetical protein CISIN_1g041307mg [Citrus sinensis]
MQSGVEKLWSMEKVVGSAVFGWALMKQNQRLKPHSHQWGEMCSRLGLPFRFPGPESTCLSRNIDHTFFGVAN